LFFFPQPEFHYLRGTELQQVQVQTEIRRLEHIALLVNASSRTGITKHGLILLGTLDGT